MASVALAFVFILELILGLILLWHWIIVRDRLKKIDERLSESLDDQDLLDFQERVSGLLGEVRETGQAMTSQIEQRRAALDREIARARETEKHLVHKIDSFNKEQARAKEKFEAKMLKLGKKAGVSAPGQMAPSALKRAVNVPKQTETAGLPAREMRPNHSPSMQLPASTRYQKVYDMADQGFSRQEICKACGYLAGEVELILNLRPRSKAGG